MVFPNFHKARFDSGGWWCWKEICGNLVKYADPESRMCDHWEWWRIKSFQLRLPPYVSINCMAAYNRFEIRQKYRNTYRYIHRQKYKYEINESSLSSYVSIKCVAVYNSWFEIQQKYRYIDTFWHKYKTQNNQIFPPILRLNLLYGTMASVN